MGGEYLGSEGPYHQIKIGTDEGNGRILELKEERDLDQGSWTFGEGTHPPPRVRRHRRRQPDDRARAPRGPRIHRRLRAQGPRLLLPVLPLPMGLLCELAWSHEKGFTIDEDAGHLGESIQIRRTGSTAGPRSPSSRRSRRSRLRSERPPASSSREAGPSHPTCSARSPSRSTSSCPGSPRRVDAARRAGARRAHGRPQRAAAARDGRQRRDAQHPLAHVAGRAGRARRRRRGGGRRALQRPPRRGDRAPPRPVRGLRRRRAAGARPRGGRARALRARPRLRRRDGQRLHRPGGRRAGDLPRGSALRPVLGEGGGARRPRLPASA